MFYWEQLQSFMWISENWAILFFLLKYFSKDVVSWNESEIICNYKWDYFILQGAVTEW